MGKIQSAATSNMNLSAAIVGSQTLPLQKDSHSNLASTSAGHHENWGESNMADASPRTDTSTDDTDDKNQRVNLMLPLFMLCIWNSVHASIHYLLVMPSRVRI